MSNNPRQTAFRCLTRIEKDGAYSNLLLEKALRDECSSSLDRAFVSALVLGVIERKITLDYELSLYLSKPLKKLKPEVLTVLRLGAYQIFYMDKVPDSAAVNESVRLTKSCGLSYASSLVNAVLRKCSKNGVILPDEAQDNYLSVRYSCPQWLIDKWTDEYGEEDTKGFLPFLNEKPKTTIRVNTTKVTADELSKLLLNEGIKCEPTDLENAIDIDLCGNDITSLKAFKDGLFHVQDKASQLCVKALSPQKGDTVFDLCASPGGKSFTIAEYMENEGKILSFDKLEKRTSLISSGAERLGLTAIKTDTADAEVYKESLGFADRVLCDVPCSGLGVISKKPEIKYKNESDFSLLPKTQLKILTVGSKYVKRGGRLVYSTCTLNKKENEDVCAAFLRDNPNFEPIAALPQISSEPYVTLMPHKNDCDGFFFAAFERKK